MLCVQPAELMDDEDMDRHSVTQAVLPYIVLLELHLFQANEGYSNILLIHALLMQKEFDQ